jgi:hypothetical protein
MRHNQRPFGKANSSSPSRNHPGGTFSGVTLESASSFSYRSAWRSIFTALLEHVDSPFWLRECPQRKACPVFAASSSREANPKL